ncbi:hypothetical protein D9M69_491610 [compost metagenome]
MTQPNLVSDAAQGTEFGLGDRGAAIGGRLHGRINAQQLARSFEPVEQVGQRAGGGDGGVLCSDAADTLLEILETGLQGGAIQQPGVIGHDPVDRPGRHAVLQQPQAGIDAGLAGPHHDIGRPGLANARQLVRRYAGHPRGDPVPGGMGGGHLGLGVGAIDQLAPYPHPPLLAAEQGDEAMVGGPIAAVVAHGEVTHTTGRQEPLVHDLIVITEDVRSGRQLIQAFAQRGAVFLPTAQFTGVHAVAGRRLVKPHEGIGVVPVAARLAVPIHHQHASVRLAEQGVDERHRRGARADHQVVGFQQFRLHGDCPHAGIGPQPLKASPMKPAHQTKSLLRR